MRVLILKIRHGRGVFCIIIEWYKKRIINNARLNRREVLKMSEFYPEGSLIDTAANQRHIRSAEGLAEAAEEGRVLEARAVLCDSSLSVSRIAHPSDRFTAGMDVLGVVSSLENGRVCLSHRELLGTWEENAALFSQGETVAGIIRSVEEYGVFVELTPNLAGLAEPREGVFPGQHAGVYIKSILPSKMKLKLVIIDTSPPTKERKPPKYFISGGHIDRWVYSPPGCPKLIETVFE